MIRKNSIARSAAPRANGEDADKRGMDFPSNAVCVAIIVGDMWLCAGVNAAGYGHSRAVDVFAAADAPMLQITLRRMRIEHADKMSDCLLSDESG